MGQHPKRCGVGAFKSRLILNKEKNIMTLKETFINAAIGAENCKVILGIRMLDGTKEMIINDNVENKVEYVCGKYDDDLKMIGAPICIEEFLFIKK